MKIPLVYKRRWFYLLLIAVSIITFSTTRWAARRAYQAPNYMIAQHEQGLRAENLDFGEVWENSSFRWNLQIANPTSRNITISRFRTTCDCTSIEPKSMELPAGSTRTVTVTLDLRTKSRQVPEIRGFQVGIAPEFFPASPIANPPWFIRGRVKRGLQLSTHAIDFGRVSELAQSPISETVTVHLATDAIKTIEVTTESQAFNVARPIEQTSPNGHKIIIAPRPLLPVGVHVGSIQIASVEAVGIGRAFDELQARLEVLCDAQPIPNRVLLGVRDQLEIHIETVEFYSLTNSPFSVAVEQTQGDGLRVELVSTKDDLKERRAFRIIQQIVREGLQVNVAKFRVIDAVGSVRIVELEVRYTGAK